VIDCSTSEPASTLRLAAALAERSARMADAPLTRTPVEAEQGRLNCMVGADPVFLEEIRPVLSAFCENVFHAGPLGAGHKTKLVNNFLAMGQAALIAEAVAACAATGVDLRRLHEVVTAGGVNSGIFQMIVGKAMEGDLEGMRFAISNGRKDLRYYRHLTEAAGLAAPLGDQVHNALAQAENLGLGDRMIPSLIEAQEMLNGIGIIDKG
jgi:3-hydroxyisobutyrate dehydrogenase-like beta-hydroxyacid dehydrogenase